MNTNSYFGTFWWLVHMEGELDLQNLCKLGLGGYPLWTLFAHHTHGLRWIALSFPVTLKAVVMSTYDAGGGGSAVLQYEGEKKIWCWCHETISLCSQTVYQHLEHYNCISHFIYMYIHCEYRNIELHLATNHDSVWINIYLMLSGVSQLYQTLSQPFSAFSMDKYLYGATWCATVLPTIVPAIQYG